MTKWIAVFGVCLISCSPTRELKKVSFDSKYINYAKVKAKVNTNSYGNIRLKGHIYLVKDSLLYFKFYGPLSVEALSGVYQENFFVNDLYHNIKYTDVTKDIYIRTGIIFDRQVLQNLLVGDLILMKARLLQINDGYLRFDLGGSSRKPFLSIISDKGMGQLRISMTKSKTMLLSKIFLECTKCIENWSLTFEFVEISNEKRKLKFE
jgi:hypothetical protein